MIKYFLSFSLIVLYGCGGSSDGVSNKNPFNVKSFNPYTDDGFKYAWHLRVVEPDIASTYNITDDSNINIYGAWAKTRGGGVKVAVIDYDFNPLNADIKSNVASTYDTETNTTNIKKDISSHGTSIASIIASPKNGIGVIGVAPETKLILIDANISSDYSNDTNKIRAFYKAKELGAKVICCSWGSLSKVSSQMKDTLKNMYNSGITVIFASGNNGGLDLDSDVDFDDESESPYVIGVGASTEQNTKADYSNYGDNIDILAPGGSASFGIYSDRYYDSNYDYLNGTSAAAPIVAGVVALMLSVNHDLTPKQIRDIIISTAQKIDPKNANYDQNGFSHTHAYGKINASAAVAKALTY